MDAIIEHPEEYLEFFRLFNEGEYYDAHEVLEDLWVIEVQPLKDYYKGLIQAAAAILHWERGNLSGARKLYQRSRDVLSPYPDFYEGFALGAFRDDMEALFGPLLDDTTTLAPVLDKERIPRLGVEG